MYLLTTINAMDIDLAKKSGSGGCGPRGGMHNNKTMYSQTSESGHSEKRTTSVQRPLAIPPIDFSIALIHL